MKDLKFFFFVDPSFGKKKEKIPLYKKLLRKGIIKITTFFIPKANPDFEHAYDKVVSWMVEISDSGEPIREIEFDENVIVKGPYKENHGFWTDTNLGFNDLLEFKLKEVSKNDFEKTGTS